MEQMIAAHQMRADDGTEYEVFEFQEYQDASTFDGEGSIKGLKSLRLSNGRHVNWIDDDTFQIVGSGTIIRRA
jgi:hypothetical protein